MTYRLKILPRAERDLQEMYDWIFDRSEAGAARWYAAFHDAASRLLSNPHAPARAPEDGLSDHPIRQFLFKTRRGRVYRAVYAVIDDEVRILRVRGPGQPDLTADELPSAE